MQSRPTLCALSALCQGFASIFLQAPFTGPPLTLAVTFPLNRAVWGLSPVRTCARLAHKENRVATSTTRYPQGLVPYERKPLFFNGFCQFEKIWENHEKRQLHSQLHSNCIQKMAVPTLPRTTTCSSSMAGLFFFAHDGSFIALSNKTIKKSKNSE